MLCTAQIVYNVLQCLLLLCNVVQCFAMFCKVVQCCAMFCNVLQCLLLLYEREDQVDRSRQDGRLQLLWERTAERLNPPPRKKAPYHPPHALGFQNKWKVETKRSKLFYWKICKAKFWTRPAAHRRMVTILAKDPFELVEDIGDLTFEHVKGHLYIR